MSRSTSDVPVGGGAPGFRGFGGISLMAELGVEEPRGPTDPNPPGSGGLGEVGP